MKTNTLIDVLKDRKVLDDVGITFIESSGQDEFISYAALYNSALNGLALLQSQNIAAGDELVFQIEDNKTFLITFWACILGGIIPVPLSVGQKEDHKKKLFSVWEVLNKPALVISIGKVEKMKAFAAANNLETTFASIESRVIDAEDILVSEKQGEIHPATATDIAFIQFSSGSTGSPKGIVLTHKNLITNVGAIAAAASYTSNDSMLSWMPLTHDMGMIGFHLNPLFCEMNQYLMHTNQFVRRPAMWLDTASNNGITILCSPNFGYKYILKHCPESKEYNWDLSKVRLIYNGAEPISEQLCDDFLDRMENYGLERKAMCPVYGLAEASLAVTISALENELVALHLNRNHLNFGDQVVVTENPEESVSVLNVGKAINDCAIKITDKNNNLVSEEIIGHLHIKGDNVTGGYYNNEKESKEVINDGWLNTGDLGFIKAGELYITGRAKDIIFINGQNYYPHDIEEMAQLVDGVELNKIAVVGYFNNSRQKEETIVFVFHRGKLQKFLPIAQALRECINRNAGFEPDRIIPVKDIPRTTSGKLQRFKLLQQYQKGAYQQIEEELEEISAQLNNDNLLPVPPENEIEKSLLEIWQSVLGTKTIGITHKFFENGGNSLKAAEIGMKLWKAFQVELPFDFLYQKQTVQELAQAINQLEQQAYVPIAQVEEREYFKLSSIQERLYYTWEIDRNSIAYNTPIAFKIIGKIETSKLEACLKKLIARHDTLRTEFKKLDDPFFTIKKEVLFSLERFDCESVLLDQKLKSLVQPFDLFKAPLFRITQLKVSDQDQFLFFDFHHIISDGISVHNFLDELMLLYSGDTLIDLPIQFKDYVDWKNDQLETQKVADQENYWLNALGTELPILEMPLDFARPTIFNMEGAKKEFELGTKISQQLRDLAKEQQCTLHVLMLSLYRLALTKYTGQEDTIVGIPVGGRTHPDLQHLQGMFVNNLAIRNGINNEENFLQFLEKESENVMQALQNQDYPFGQIIQHLGGKRDMSRNPIFDTMFIFQNQGIPESSTQEFSLSRYFLDPGFSKFDLSMEIFEEDSLKYALEYATSLFLEETIVNFARHFEQLVKSLLENPTSKIAELSALSKQEHHKYVHEFNDTAAPYLKDKTIHQLFEAQVQRTPTNIALEFNSEVLTYETLNQRANSLATMLRKKGLTPNDVAVILLPMSPAFIISVLAILKAGGSYLPVDTDSPQERMRYIIEDSNSTMLITDSSLVGFATEAGAKNKKPVVNLSEWKPAAVKTITNVNTPNDLAYTIYTSGTTGQPKGVMIEHRSLVNYINWASAVYVKNEKIAFPLFTSVSFDLTVTSIFTPLVTGNTIVVYEKDNHQVLIEKIIAENKVGVIKLTPSHLKILNQGNLKNEISTSNLKRFIIGGEVLDTTLTSDIYQLFNEKIELYNEYGPTEATVGCMIHQFDPNEQTVSVPIGIPAANTQIYVLDKFLKPVPKGVKGELYIAGDGLARGYMGKEELTKEKFIANPFHPNERMYKTGDIVKRLSSGTIEYLERIDQQIKINGYRIELAEIEQQLLLQEAVSVAIATVKLNQHKQKILFAYYQCGNEKKTDAIALRNFLAERLPHYMMPVHFIEIAEIPLTLNGKIDYSALPEVVSEIEKNVLPLGELEETLLAVWQEVFGEDVVVADNFFELGGDSIKAVQIASKLNGKGINVQVKDILNFQTIKQISPRARISKKQLSYEQGVVIGEKDLSPIEHWFFGQHFEVPGHYNQSVLLKVNADLNIKLLEQAFDVLIKHHDGLRLNFDQKKGKLFFNNQHLDTNSQIKNFTTNARSFNGDGEESLVILSELKDKFDIHSSLLLNAGVVQLESNIEYLCITAHHLIIDGISWRILLEDLYVVYNSLEKGQDFSLPQKTANLLDWQKALETFTASGISREELAYWQTTKETDFSIPMDHQTDDWRIENLKVIKGELNEKQTSFLLKEAHQIYSTDVPILLNTALVLALKEWTGNNRFVVEHENHGRHLEGIDTSRSIGWFTAMYPVLLELRDEDLGEQIKAIKEQMRKVPNKGLGYGICKYMTDHFGLEKKELSEIRFNYLGQFGEEMNNDLFSYSDLNSGKDIATQNSMSAKIDCNLIIINGKLAFDFSYNQKAFSLATIASLVRNFLKHLDIILDHINQEKNIHFTPSDFDAVEIDQQELDVLFE